MKISENYSLLKHNTFGMDVKTRWFVEYENETDLQKLLSDEYFFSLPFLHIGEGSNLLFLDDFPGVIVHSLIRGIEVIDEDEHTVSVKSGAGVNWDDFVAYCVQKQWHGIENLSLIPGEVGASTVQNIGAYGVEACETISEVHAYHVESGEKRIFNKEECRFSYRKSIFKENDFKGKYFITHVIFKLSKHPDYKLNYGNLKEILSGQEISLSAIRKAVIYIRENKLPDPKKMGNAGSFFMNPYICMEHYEGLKAKYPQIPHFPVNEEVVKIPAAWLIDQCGLKGHCFGNAAIHEKQPLVIVNKGGATANDIASLAKQVQDIVFQKFRIELHREVNYI